MARSPIAWTITWSPALSAPLVRSYRSFSDVTRSPLSFGASVNGLSMSAVCEPMDPSTNALSPPIMSHASPRPRAATVSRSCCQLASGTTA